MKLKICGLRHSENINSLLQLSPDYLGFIFYQKSKRYAAGILEGNLGSNLKLPSNCSPIKTGVFVNESRENIIAIVEKYALNAVQLHGDETPSFCQKLSNKNLEIIKVFSIDDGFDFEKTKDYENVCDLFLFDTSGKERGGNGTAFNWQLLNKYKGNKPFFISGGIGPDDAPALLKIKHPKLYGVDINSCFEIGPGLKDFEMVKKFRHELID